MAAEEKKTFGTRKHVTAILISVFLGGLGIDRFYMGLTGTGILKLLTLGGCGVWTMVDWILIATNSLKDGDGKYLQP
jgi:TM2 domain-containing membrane protein YozV